MNRYLLLLLAAQPTLIAGCQSGDGFSPPTPKLLAPPSRTDVKALNSNIATWVASYTASTDPDQRKDYRNKIVAAVMQQIDANFLSFDDDIWKNRDLSDFAFDMTNIALGFTGTIVGGTGTKTVTNALVTVITGTKMAVNTDFYNQQAALAISAKMKALRSAQSTILINHTSDSDSSYPLAPDALQDLTSYYRAGTVLGALQDITANSDATSTANNNVKNFVQAATSGAQSTSQPATSSSTTQASMGQSGPTSRGSQKFLLVRDMAGHLHLYDRGTQAEIKFDASGVPTGR